MVFKDFGIKSREDLFRMVVQIANRVEDDIENCPFFRRAKKAAERMLRFQMKSLEVSDLPTGKRQ